MTPLAGGTTTRLSASSAGPPGERGSAEQASATLARQVGTSVARSGVCSGQPLLENGTESHAMGSAGISRSRPEQTPVRAVATRARPLKFSTERTTAVFEQHTAVSVPGGGESRYHEPRRVASLCGGGLPGGSGSGKFFSCAWRLSREISTGRRTLDTGRPRQRRSGRSNQAPTSADECLTSAP